jgi:hypothetical protein
VGDVAFYFLPGEGTPLSPDLEKMNWGASEKPTFKIDVGLE